MKVNIFFCFFWARPRIRVKLARVDVIDPNRHPSDYNLPHLVSASPSPSILDWHRCVFEEILEDAESAQYWHLTAWIGWAAITCCRGIRVWYSKISRVSKIRDDEDEDELKEQEPSCTMAVELWRTFASANTANLISRALADEGIAPRPSDSLRA
jgi:hypothetical protein